MSRVNVSTKTAAPKTHEGATAVRTNAEQQLARSVMSCMLWEGEFYEDGKSIASRIDELVGKVNPEKVAEIASRARNEGNLRHVPLLLARGLAKRHYPVASLLEDIIQRPDELTEFLAIYWKDGKQPLAAQVKKGLARAFRKFDAYQLAKYNRDTAIKLKDVLFLSHAKPLNDNQAKMWKDLIDGNLPTPVTWETVLSEGKLSKKDAWNKLLAENKLGAMALLRNLRNMQEAGVSKANIRQALMSANYRRVLPFRFISAAITNPKIEDMIEEAFLNHDFNQRKLSGKTIFIIDMSGSMSGIISGKSVLSRYDAGIALAMLVREAAEEASIYATAGNDWRGEHATQLIPSRRGFGLRDAIKASQRNIGGGGIFLTQCLDYIYKHEKTADRIIVFTDEQDCDHKLNPSKANAFGDKNYLINVASYRNGIGYKPKWIHIDGFSDAVINWIYEYENL